MTALRFWTLACDVCGEEFGFDGHVGPLRKQAKRQGWTRKKLRGVLADLCPDDATATDATPLYFEDKP